MSILSTSHLYCCLSQCFITMKRCHDQENLQGKHLIVSLLKVSEDESMLIVQRAGRHGTGAVDENLHPNPQVRGRKKCDWT